MRMGAFVLLNTEVPPLLLVSFCCINHLCIFGCFFFLFVLCVAGDEFIALDLRGSFYLHFISFSIFFFCYALLGCCIFHIFLEWPVHSAAYGGLRIHSISTWSKFHPIITMSFKCIAFLIFYLAAIIAQSIRAAIVRVWLWCAVVWYYGIKSEHKTSRCVKMEQIEQKTNAIIVGFAY